MFVLVVDDDDLVRSALIDLIRGWGVEAWGVEHGRAALDYLENSENERPSLIVLDGRMPVMSGQEFLQHRELHAAIRAIPVVVFSGTVYEITCRTAEGYVCKPFIHDVRPYVEKFCTV